MPKIIKRFPALFILLSLFLFSILTPFLLPAFNPSAPAERKVLAVIKIIEGNAFGPEKRAETLVRGEQRLFCGSGTSFFFISPFYASAFSLLACFLFYTAPDFSHNPVRIADFIHMGDGMK